MTTKSYFKTLTVFFNRLTGIMFRPTKKNYLSDRKGIYWLTHTRNCKARVEVVQFITVEGCLNEEFNYLSTITFLWCLHIYHAALNHMIQYNRVNWYTDHTDFCRDKVAKTIEPFHIGLKISGSFHVTELWLSFFDLFNKSLYKFFWPDVI